MGRDMRELSGVVGCSVSYKGWSPMGTCICQNSLTVVFKICAFNCMFKTGGKKNAKQILNSS